MTEVTSHSLYSREILRLASLLPHQDKLADPCGSATCRAPICGSEMTADVTLDQSGRITGLAIRAHACALGQASAALVREKAVGLNRAEIISAHDSLEQALCSNAKSPSWAELEPFLAARDHTARHGAILLPFTVVLAAIENAAL